MDVKGSINAIGNSNDRIICTSDVSNPWNYSNLTIINYLQTNPLFVSSSDYHLSANSPCINAGDNYATIMIYDLDGNQRIDNTYNITDYGCYEYGSIPYPKRKSKPGTTWNNDMIKVYPNPASEFVYISISNMQINEISIYSLSGQRVYFNANPPVNQELIVPLSSFNPGAYIIKMQSNTSTQTKSLIVR